MRSISLLFVCAAGLAAQSYRAEIIAGPGEVRPGPALESQLRAPGALALAPDGSVVFADPVDRRIWRVTPAGRLEIVAGTGAFGPTGDGGPAAVAALDAPFAPTFDSAGNLFFADRFTIRRVDARSGIITRFAGNGSNSIVAPAGDGGPALRAAFTPRSLAFDRRGDLYISDSNGRVRRIAADTGVVSTFAGGGSGQGCDNCPATQAVLSGPFGSIAFDRAGALWILQNLTRFRRVDPATGVITTPLTSGTRDADGIPASEARWSALEFAFDGQGDLLLMESVRVRRIPGAAGTGLISTVTGGAAAGFARDGVASAEARFFGLTGILPRGDDLFLSDYGNAQIRLLSGGTLRTFAGAARTGRPATQVALAAVRSAAVATDGSLVVTGAFPLRFRQGANGENLVDLASLPLAQPAYADLKPDRQGNVWLQLQNGGLVRVDAAGTATLFSVRASTFALDSAGNVAYSDPARALLVRLNPATGTTSPLVITESINASAITVDARDRIHFINGGFWFRLDAPLTSPVRLAPIFSFELGGDGGPLATARFGNPSDMAADSRGSVFLMDLWHNVIRRVSADGIVTTVVPPPFLSGGSRITVDPNDNLIVSNPERSVVYRFTPVAPASLGSVSLAGQTRRTGSSVAWSVAVRNADGSPAIGVPVDFSIVSGGGTLAANRAFSGNDGVATVLLNAPAAAGRVTLRAASGALDPVTWEVALAEQLPAGAPSINTGGVISAGLFNRLAGLSPGGIASIFGSGFAASGPVRPVQTSDLVDGRVPTSFASVCVRVGATLAPVFAVGPEQINFQVPWVAAGGPATVRVIRNCGAPDARESEPVFVPVLILPEFFHFQDRFVAAIDAASGAFIGPAGLLPGATFTPARPGQVVTLFATGLGATDPAIDAGQFPTGPARLVTQYTLQLGNAVVPPADIFYAGVTPFNPGLYQINFRVPDDLAPGEYRINQSNSVLVVGAR